MTRKLIVFHILNDYSGSPKILATVLSGLLSDGWSVDLYTSSGRGGFLSEVEGIKFHRICYRFTNNRILTFTRFLILQFRYFFIALKYRKDRSVIFYLNTILPFGAALGAKLVHGKIIYHVHEYPVRKHFINKIAKSVMLKYADKALFVSEYLLKNYHMKSGKKVLVRNALTPGFSSTARNFKPDFKQPFNILMICSLRKFKGIDIFYDLSLKLTKYNFNLVLNANQSEVDDYFKPMIIPENLRIYTAARDLDPIYRMAHLVVNLSLPDLCIESFGLTILEAMAYGLPVIVPPFGGICELVEDGINGYKVDPRDIRALEERISWIFSDGEKYFLFSSNARLMAEKFSYLDLIAKIGTVLKEL